MLKLTTRLLKLSRDIRPSDVAFCIVQDRTDRELVTPWFKFLWETYRNILDTLRNYSRLEALYAMTAARAFQFCLHYKRTTEFRRLCDILRNHLQNLNRHELASLGNSIALDCCMLQP